MQLYDINEYRASKDWPYALAAGCVVFRFENGKPKVLLLRRDPRHVNDPHQTEVTYMLPKGHVSFNESIEVAAVRETEEEAACKVELKTYLGSTSHEFTHPRHHVVSNKTTLYFAARWLSDTNGSDDEHDGREWVSVEEAKQKLSVPNYRQQDEIIQRFEKYLELTSAA